MVVNLAYVFTQMLRWMIQQMAPMRSAIGKLIEYESSGIFD